jgi:hypothetical protein
MEQKGNKLGQVYQDFSRLTEEDETCVFQLWSMDGSMAMATAVGDNFPSKLYGLLVELDQSGLYAHVASWAPHGRCFKVHKPKEFVDLFLCRCVVKCCCAAVPLWTLSASSCQVIHPTLTSHISGILLFLQLLSANQVHFLSAAIEHLWFQ